MDHQSGGHADQQSDEITELRMLVSALSERVQELGQAAAKPSTVGEPGPKRRPARLRPARRRRRVVLGAAVGAAAALTVVGVAAATPTSTTSVSFIALSPAHKVLNATTIAANKSTSPVVAGGTTTVPTNATVVQLTVSAKGVAGGVINFYPAHNLAGGSGASLTYPAGSALATTTIEENVGQSDELTFANFSTGSASVTATIIGYSTQVTAGTLNGTGGTAGQVLTNDGSGGAAWANPAAGGPAGGVLTGSYPNPGLASNAVGNANLASGAVTGTKIANQTVTAGNISGTGGSFGQELVNTGAGASWQTEGQGYAVSGTSYPTLAKTQTVLDSVTVPAGTYLVTDTIAGAAFAVDTAYCVLLTPSGGAGDFAYVPMTGNSYGYPVGSGAMSMLLSTAGGTVKVECQAQTNANSILIEQDYLIATQINAGHGSVTTGAAARPNTASLGQR